MIGQETTRDLREPVPRKEYAWSRRQRLFEKNIEKKPEKTWFTNLSERFGNFIYARGKVLAPHASVTRDGSL